MNAPTIIEQCQSLIDMCAEFDRLRVAMDEPAKPCVLCMAGRPCWFCDPGAAAQRERAP